MSAVAPAIPIAGSGLVTGFGDLAATAEAVFAGAVNDRPLNLAGIADSARQTGGAFTSDQREALFALSGDVDIALGAVIAAAADARNLPRAPALPQDPELGLVLATNFGLLETLQWCWQERLDTGELDADTFAVWRDCVAIAAERVGAGGPRCQLSLSCASGTGAVALARDWIAAGTAKRVLVIAYDALTATCWTGLSNLRTITDDCVRPFDARRRGTVFSEGAAAILLDPNASAAIAVAGAACNNNAFHMTAPAKRADGSRRVLASAIADAGLSPEHVQLFSAHATGTRANDVTESEAITDLFGPTPPPVLALKSSLGHLLGAAGLAELILTAEAMRRSQLPAIQNSGEPDPDCTDAAIRQTRPASIESALINSAGIGGTNGAALLLKHGHAATNQVPLVANSTDVSDCRLGLVAAGWALSTGVGAGSALPSIARAALAEQYFPEDFSAKPYLQSVKGYLDPTGAAALATAACCLKQAGCAADELADCAIVTATRYGPLLSGYRFYEQMQQRGPQLASPMIFPHLYASTPGNLAAIEFGIAGPHLIFDHVEHLSTPFDAARNLIRLGRAKKVLLICYEYAFGSSLPDDAEVDSGAIALLLAADGAAPLPPAKAADAGVVSACLS